MGQAGLRHRVGVIERKSRQFLMVRPQNLYPYLAGTRPAGNRCHARVQMQARPGEAERAGHHLAEGRRLIEDLPLGRDVFELIFRSVGNNPALPAVERDEPVKTRDRQPDALRGLIAQLQGDFRRSTVGADIVGEYAVPVGDDILSIDAAGVEVCPGAAPGDERLPVVTLKVKPIPAEDDLRMVGHVVVRKIHSSPT